MAINDISLTAGMRTNLVSLQSTVSLLNRTQERLSTGKKVNNALDNPLNFFTAQALTSRANDLAGFKDAMSEAVQTVKAANNGITAISGLIAQAKAIAASAKTTTVGSQYTTETLTVATNFIAGQVVKVGNSSFTAVAASASATQFNIGADTSATAANLASAISTAATASAGSLNNVSVLGNVVGNVITLQSTTANLTNSDVVANNFETLTLSANVSKGDTVTVGGFTFTAVATTAGMGTTQFYATGAADTTATNLASAITTQATTSAASMSNINVIGTATAGVISLASSTADLVATSIVATGSVSSTAFAESALASVGTEGAFIASTATDRANYYTQYLGLLSQIDNLATDSGYKGTNLLGSNNLDVNFGSSATDKLTISGFDGSSTGLAMSKTVQWASNANVDTDVTAMDAATATLKAKASSLSSGLSIVNTRQDWVQSMVNTLTQGADNLTLADMNEEGANMLMLQTRQSLGTTALSLSAQAAQSVLKLF